MSRKYSVCSAVFLLVAMTTPGHAYYMSEDQSRVEITVFVRDQDGQPVTGATVLCVSEVGESEQHVCDKKEEKFVCTGLKADVPYIVQVSPPPHLKAPSPTPRIERPGDVRGDWVIDLQPEVIKGKVFDQENGEQVASAEVIAVREKEPREEAECQDTGADGRFKCEKVERGKTYKLAISHPLYVAADVPKQQPGDIEIQIPLQHVRVGSDYRIETRRGTNISARVMGINTESITIRTHQSDDPAYPRSLGSREIDLSEIAAIFRPRTKKHWIILGIVGSAAAAVGIAVAQ